MTSGQPRQDQAWETKRGQAMTDDVDGQGGHDL